MKRTCKLLLPLLLIALLLCLAGTAAADTVIKTVTVTGFSAPTENSHPKYSGVEVSTTGVSVYAYENTDTSNYWKNGVQWYNYTDKKKMTTSDTFERGKVYHMYLYIKTEAGYEFDSTAEKTNYYVSANGTYGTDSWVAFKDHYQHYSAVRLIFILPERIGSVKITGVVEPAAGETPQYSAAVSGTGYKVRTDENSNDWVNGVGWYDVTEGKMVPSGSAFQSGHKYRVIVILETTSFLYEFQNDGSQTTTAGRINDRLGTVYTVYSEVADSYKHYVGVRYTYDALSYTVKFDSMGGSAVPDKTVKPGDALYAWGNNPEKEGFVFSAWYADKDYTEKFIFGNPISQDMTLYARWSGNQVVGTRDKSGAGHGGTVTVNGSEKDVSVTTLVYENDKLTLKAYPDTGYRFLYWKVDDQDSILSDQVEYVHTVTNTQDYVVAVFEPITYTVTFETNGGSAVESLTVKHGYTFSFRYSTREDWHLDSWYKDAALSADQKFNFDSDAVTSDLTLYAKWTHQVYFYAYDMTSDNIYTGGDFYINGSGLYDLYHDFYAVNDEVDVNAVPDPDFRFVCWQDADTEAVLSEEAVTTLNIGTSTSIYAVFEDMTEYTISFDANGGTGEMAPVKVRIYNKFTAPECGFTPPKDMVFDKWNTNSSYGWQEVGEQITPSSDMTWLAEWKNAPLKEINVAFGQSAGDYLGPSNIRSEGERQRYYLNTISITGPNGDVGTGATLQEGAAYTVTLSFESEWGYTFDPASTLKINGNSTPIKAMNDTHTYFEAEYAFTVAPKTTYTVTLDGNGGSGSMAPIVVAMGDSFTVPESTFERKYYTLDYWDLLDSSWQYFDPENHGIQPGVTYTPDRDIILQAQWKALPRTPIPSLAATVVMPKAGEHPMGEYDGVTSADPEKYTCWVNYYDMKFASYIMQTTDTFESGGSYHVFVNFIPAEDYEIGDGVKATFNGEEAGYWTRFGFDRSVSYDMIVTLPSEDRLPGDVTGDGKVDIMDVIRLLKKVSGWTVEIVEKNADVTGDGNINIMDVIRLLKKVSGWDVTLA